MTYENRPFVQQADLIGDGSGTTDAIGDFSVTADEFFIRPQVGEILLVTSIIIAITDDGAFSGTGYGAGSALSNGISIQIINGTGNVREDVTDGLPVLNNNDYSRLGEVEDIVFGSGDNGLQCVITFTEPLLVRSSERLTFLVNDDFSGLVHQYFTISGSITHEC